MKFRCIRHIYSNEKMLNTVLIVSFWNNGIFYTGRSNPLPDGYQNEYLHVGNAYDLFQALIDLDVWHMRWYMYTGYWPVCMLYFGLLLMFICPFLLYSN